MSVSEKILEEVRKLPEPLQAEVPDFAQHPASKATGKTGLENEPSSTDPSLALAMRGMENEDMPVYSMDDLKQAF
ncbi:MAG: hypothetical protein V1792_17950 [Pseudomonadota bacterium]